MMAGRLTLAFLRTESSAGLAPVATAVVALMLANSPLADSYFAFLAHRLPMVVGSFSHTASIADWIKDGLMAVFFLIVGLEIKFEVLRGALSSPRRLATPLLAAAGGMFAPALVYLAVNAGPTGTVQGWPVGTPTDIAFALTALAVAGRGLPPSLRLFLMTLAIADDFGAVVLIAVLFTHALNWAALAGAGAVLALLAALSRRRRGPILLYAAGFALVWAFCLSSGVSTSVAGVACALTVPVGARRPGGESMLTLFMDALHPWVAYVILPAFAFSAAGFSFAGLTGRDVASPVSLGIALALCLGKPAGIFGVTFLAHGLKIGRRPAGASWLELLGVAALAGVGFTMSLYLGALAFAGAAADAQREVRLGILAGSLISVLAGALLIRLAARRHPATGIALQ
jgi:NhaA family Na+:H+ antiporter